MTAGGEPHHAYLLHTPLLRVVAAVAEHVLDIGQRHVPVAERQTVLKDGGADALAVEPLGCVLSLVHVGGEPVGSARADDDHLAVRVLGQIKLEPRAVSGVLQIHVLGQLLRPCAAVGLAGTKGYALYALVNVLSLRVEVDDLVRSACELLPGDFRSILLSVHALKLLPEPSFQGGGELRPARTEIVLADLRIQTDAQIRESPAVATFRIGMEFRRNLVPDQGLVELDRAGHRNRLVIRAYSDEGRGSGRGYVAVGGVPLPQPLIFIKSIVPFPEWLVLPFLPEVLAAQKVVNRSLVCGTLVHQDDGVEEHGEIGPRRRVNVHGLCRAGKMSACGESHHADLPYTPFAGMVTAVAEGVLNILERNLPVAVWQAVLQDSAGYVPVIQPFGGVRPFVPSGYSRVASAGADDDHLSVRILWHEYVDARAVGDIADEAPSAGLFRSLKPVCHKRTLGDGDSVLDYSLGGILSVGVEVHSLCRRVLDPGLSLCKQLVLHRGCPRQRIDIHHGTIEYQLAFPDLSLRRGICPDADNRRHHSGHKKCSFHILCL